MTKPIVRLLVMIIISASRKNLDHTSPDPLHPGYTGWFGQSELDSSTATLLVGRFHRLNGQTYSAIRLRYCALREILEPQEPGLRFASSAPSRLRRLWITGLLLIMVGLTACQSVPRPRAHLYPAPIASDQFILSSPDQQVVGELQVVIAGPDDTLPELARRFNLGYEEIVAANPGISIESPRGMRVVLPTQFILPDAPRQGIVINLATLRLFYFPPPAEPGDPQWVITHPIGIGREGWSTPLGKARIARKVVGPTWNVPDSIRREHAAEGDHLPGSVPPGADNPLGTHALYLSWPRYLIHGTNKPGGIGMRVSHGCIQLGHDHRFGHCGLPPDNERDCLTL